MAHEFKTTDIKGKPYVQVNERIKYFWQQYPCPKGRIQTELLKDDNGACLFRASIFVDGVLVSTGYAHEKESSSYINKTSYIENCETSAVGRALGIFGIGIDTSIATAEEVETAIANQDVGKPEVPKQEKTLRAEVVATAQKKFGGDKAAFDAWCKKKAIKTAIKDMTDGELSIMLDVMNNDNL